MNIIIWDINYKKQSINPHNKIRQIIVKKSLIFDGSLIDILKYPFELVYKLFRLKYNTKYQEGQ